MKKKKSLTQTIPTEDLFLLLCCATRYALGRRSYIVSWVNEQLRTHARAFRPQDLVILIEDIETHGRQRSYGDVIDEHTWKETLTYLKTLRSDDQTNDGGDTTTSP